MNVNLPPGKYPDDMRRAQFFEAVVKRLSAIPGVSSATASSGLPVNSRVMSPILADGQPNVPPGQRPLAFWNGVTPGYFQTFGIPLMRGRDFTWADDAKAPRVVIVSQSLAQRFWPNQTALGKHLTFTRFQAPYEIVGVVGDTKTNGLQADPGMAMFTSYAQWTFPGMSLTLRTGARSQRLQHAVDCASAGIGFRSSSDSDAHRGCGNGPASNATAPDHVPDRRIRRHRARVGANRALRPHGVFGGAAQYGDRHSASRGHKRADILRMVFGQAIRLSLIGIGVGSAAAIAIMQLVAGLLFHVSAADPPTFAGIAVLFLAVSLLATYIPARRATRIDPLVAMRAR